MAKNQITVERENKNERQTYTILKRVLTNEGNFDKEAKTNVYIEVDTTKKISGYAEDSA